MSTTVAAAPTRYRVELADLNAHLYRVTLRIAQPLTDQRVSLPVWIPGSYLVREFSKQLQNLQARQGRKAVKVMQQDKCSWLIACQAGRPLTLQYEVYAYDNSVRTAWLDPERAFFNGTSLFLRVEGQEEQPHALELRNSPATQTWDVATGLSASQVNRRGFGTYLSSNYHELVDCPVQMGAFWSGDFVARGLPHRLVVSGAPPSFDGARLLADTQKICETEIAFWHGLGASKSRQAPHRDYLFLLNATADNYGGLEHRNSTALICGRKDLPRLAAKASTSSPPSDGYVTLLGLISHEYFHTWNVKRLRPAEFATLDYRHENYTELLWFFEGCTSYYDDLLLRRAGLIDDSRFLKLLNTSINQVQQTPGSAVQSVAQASFDAWVKFYRPDENSANATVSYYNKGALVALCLDLTLRAEGPHSLDDVMRALWQRSGGGPISEDDIAAVLQALSGRSYAPELAAWVHGRADLPLRPLLERHGVTILEEPAQLAQQLGLRLQDGGPLQIKTVLRGGAAERAGFAAGDEWLGLTVGSGKRAQSWRLTRLDELPLYAGPHQQVQALVARDQRLLQLKLTLPASASTWRLTVRDPALLQRWLAA